MTKRRSSVRIAPLGKQRSEDEARRVRDDVVRAWQDEQHPGPIEPHCQRPDCPAIAAYFSSQTWQSVRLRELRAAVGGSWDAPWHFLPPRAIRYFLPAFLCMYLDETSRRLDVLGSAVVLSVCPHDGWRAGQRAALEPLLLAQKRAVLSFLRLAQHRDPSRPEVGRGIELWARAIARDEEATVAAGAPGTDLQLSAASDPPAAR